MINQTILCIGGGTPELYNDKFYQVGNHPCSHYGSGLDWNNLDFWINLSRELNNYEFNAILFDNGSESWIYQMPELVFYQMMETLLEHLVFNGIILIEGIDLYYPDFELKITNYLEKNINIIGKIGFKSSVSREFIIFSKTNDLYLTTLNNFENINDIYTQIGELSPRLFVIRNNNFKLVDEYNQIDFISNRC